MFERLVFCCLVSAAVPAFADGTTPVTLWVAEGAHNQVYLLGSVHLLRKGDYPLPDVIERAYDDAESLVMEIDMDDLDPVETQALVTRLGVLPDDRTLEDVLGPEDYAVAEAAAVELDIPLSLLDKSEPWLAAITIEQLILSRLGFNAMHGVEMTFLGKARRDAKPIEGLETFAEQIGFLDGLSPAAQRDLLLQSLTEGAELRGIMDSLIEAWKTGDVGFMESRMLDELAKFPELYDVIVVDRNRRWIDQLVPLMQHEDDYLVIVGALHLIGDDGVPAMLEAAGVDVAQLNTGSVIETD